MRRSLDFYRRVLGFEQGGGQGADAYTPMVNGAVRLALNLRSELLSDHPIQRAAHEGLDGGVELVLEVGDIDAIYRHVVAQQWPRSAELMRRPWNLTDFRVLDPTVTTGA